MELMEQQLVRCGVPSVRLYEHLAISSPAAAAAALSVHQHHQHQHQQQQQQHEGSQHGAHQLPPWLSPSSTLLYSGVTQNHSRGGTPTAYPGSPTFPYPVGVALPWPWQPPVTMISRRSSPSSATASPGVRYAPYPRPASTPPPLRARPSTPN